MVILEEGTNMYKYEKVEHDSDRDYWMTAEEALAYGMIDKVLVRNK